MSRIPPVIPLDGRTLSSSPERSSVDEINPKPVVSSSITFPASNQQHQNGLSSNLSGTIDSFNNKTSTVGNVPSGEMSSMSISIDSCSSPTDDLSLEQKSHLLRESADQVNLSSLKYLQTKQRQINHRRNKSEPVILGNLAELSSLTSYPNTSTKAMLESSSTSTTSNESALSANASFEKKKKSSNKKTSPILTDNKQILNQERPSTSSITKKKKPCFRNSHSIDEHFIKQTFSFDNLKSYFSTHPSSTSFPHQSPSKSIQLETYSGSSFPILNQQTNIVANASESISNVQIFTLKNQYRRHSWTGKDNPHEIVLPIRRTKSQTRKVRIRRKNFVNEPLKSVTYPLTKSFRNQSQRHSLTPTRSEKSTAFLTATSLLKFWPFQSTYRQRNEDFRKLFKDLPADERLIVDYSCAWQKEILTQGRMYISQNYLCFHANFLKWETSLCLKFQDIIGITREKTAKVIPNAIEVRTNKSEKYFFASFATRDKSYAMIFRIWQTIFAEQPISTQQMWNMIRESYGNDLDMITDEEDSYNKTTSTNSTPDKTSLRQQERDISNSISSTNSKKEEIDDHSSISSRSERPTDDDIDVDDDLGIIPIGEEANTNTLIRQPPSTLNKQENPLLTMTDHSEQTYLNTCPCQSHLATKLIDRSYSTSVQRLFEYIFDDRDFLAAYHASRRIKDFQTGEWIVNPETGKRERLCTYKVGVAAVFGATTICSNEKQIIDCESSKSHYIIDTEVRNEGIRYADTFFIASRYCLIQTGPNKSHLKVTCEVRYVKSVMVIIKSFVEKNAMAALQDSFTDLMKRIEHETSGRQRSSSRTNHYEKEKSNSLPKKKHPRKQQINENDSSIDNSTSVRYRNVTRQEDQQPNDSNLSQSTDLTSSTWSTKNFLFPFCIIIMLILLTVNIFLCVKLNEIDRMTDRLVQNYPLWSNDFSYPKQDNEWSILLKRQEEYYQTKLNGLHSVLLSTHNALKNVTDALNELSKLSSGSK
ncbi:unnamed protein product [Adineta ricciae]|uniref:VASt domain-containing protein n=1 Tax=Adineta ricciae TaxID=249248 RepID=A0A815H6G3_ADIRI|nr:unnamed protein product [Adineta ricciae]